MAEATRRKYNNYKILNICDMPVAIMLSFAKMLGLEKYNDVDPVYFGLNHFGWWTHLYDKSGVDRMPELKEKIMKFGLAASHDKHHSDPSWRHTWENFKEILTDFPEYLPIPTCSTICMPRKAPRIWIPTTRVPTWSWMAVRRT